MPAQPVALSYAPLKILSASFGRARLRLSRAEVVPVGAVDNGLLVVGALQLRDDVRRRLARRALLQRGRRAEGQGHGLEAALRRRRAELIEILAAAPHEVLCRRVADPRLDAERLLARLRGQRVLRAAPRRLHHLPRVGRRFVGVNQQRAGRALPRRLLELVGPAAVVRQRGPAEERGLIGRRGRIVHHDHHPLALHVRARVVVPLQLRRLDAVADEHDVALHLHARRLAARDRDHVLVVAVGVARHAEREVPVHRGLDDRDLLEPGAVGRAGLETERGHLRREVLAGEAAAARRWRAPLEQVRREHLDVRRQRNRADFTFDGAGRRRGRGRGRAGREGDEGGKRQQAHAGQY